MLRIQLPKDLSLRFLMLPVRTMWTWRTWWSCLMMTATWAYLTPSQIQSRQCPKQQGTAMLP